MVFLDHDTKDSKNPEQTVQINELNWILKMHVGIYSKLAHTLQEIKIYL